MAPLDGVASASEFDPVYYGHDGVRTFWRTWFSAWEKASFEYEEFVDAGDNVVTILSRHVRGRASGIELDWKSYGQIWTVRNGKIVASSLFTIAEKPSKPPGCGSSSDYRFGREAAVPRSGSGKHCAARCDEMRADGAR